MAKKRQADFPKTQLKPGRPVGRKRVTNTSFKSKKITIQRKEYKARGKKTISECLKIIKGSSQISQRLAEIKKLNHLITHEFKDSLSVYLSDVLDYVFKNVLESDEQVRNEIFPVIKSILDNTKDFQLHSFIAQFQNVLSCGMTNLNSRIKEDSLRLLYHILKTHPILVCHSMTVLNHLLQMLLDAPRKWTHSQSTRYKSNLGVLFCEHVFSPDWRINALGHMNLFIQEMLKSKTSVLDNDCDEQEVYWNSENPLNLEIYAGGGLKPVDIEKSYSNSFNFQVCFDDSVNIESLIMNIVNILPIIFIEVMTESKGDDNLLSENIVKDLNILFQVLSSITDWMKLINYDAMDTVIMKFLKERIYDKGKFPILQRENYSGKKAFPCVQANLALCFLFSTYLLEVEKDNETLNSCIFSCIKDIFKMNYEIRYESIPMLVKIIEIYFGMRETPEVTEFLHDSLSKLCRLLKGHDDRLKIKLLISLFTKISLDSAFHFLAETDVMKLWFEYLFNELAEIPIGSSVNKRLLRIIKKIANRKYPCFLQRLAETDFRRIRGLLKFDDDDVRDTAIFLIYNMKEISTDLLENISSIILQDSSFPTKFSLRLIRLLAYRFFEKPEDGEIPKSSIYNGKGLIDITQFLLNIAIDSFSVNNEKWIDLESNDYTRALKPFNDVFPYSVFPSLHWKEHSILFEVCAKFLNQLPQNVVNNVAMMVIKEILDSKRNLPMHCVIAIFKLNSREMKEKTYRFSMYGLVFSALITTSILTHMSIDDEWYKCNVVELMNSMVLNRRAAMESMKRVEYLRDDLEGITVYHILRVCKFFLERNLLESDDLPGVKSFLNILKEKCSDKTIHQQPLFVHMNNICDYYA